MQPTNHSAQQIERGHHTGQIAVQRQHRPDDAPPRHTGGQIAVQNIAVKEQAEKAQPVQRINGEKALFIKRFQRARLAVAQHQRIAGKQKEQRHAEIAERAVRIAQRPGRHIPLGGKHAVEMEHHNHYRGHKAHKIQRIIPLFHGAPSPAVKMTARLSRRPTQHAGQIIQKPVGVALGQFKHKHAVFQPGPLPPRQRR